MGNIQNIEIAGPEHPSFNLEQAWYTFGVFTEDGSIQALMVVETENNNAVHMIESLVQQNGSVSNTCGLVAVSTHPPQIRSTIVREIGFVDFIIDMVDADRWLGSPFLISLFRQSLSDVDVAVANLKIDQAIRLHEWEQGREQAKEMEEEATGILVQDPAKLEKLRAGLVGLGFSKHDVKVFTASVEDKSDSLQELLKEGIETLNRGLS